MSFTTTTTFTRTNARYLASKIAADLKQLNSFYGRPTKPQIEDYYEELSEMLAGGYVATFEAGFRENGKRVVTVRYTIIDGVSSSDERAGGIHSRADVSSASWFTFLTHSQAWRQLTNSERRTIEDSVPVDRTPGNEPADGNGYWETGRSYESGGTSASRSGFRPA